MDWYLVIGPLALLPVVALLAFVGCSIDTTALGPRAPTVSALVLRFRAEATVTIAWVAFTYEWWSRDRATDRDTLMTQTTLPERPTAGMETLVEHLIPDPELVSYSLTCHVMRDGPLPDTAIAIARLDMLSDSATREVIAEFGIRDGEVTVTSIREI